MKIALTGKMRSGKDTVAERIIFRYGLKEFKLSSGISDTIDLLFGRNPDNKNRLQYQFIGQTMRQLDQEVWLKYTMKKIQSAGSSQIIISDLRQENEEEFLRKRGFIIIKVESEDSLRKQRIVDSGDIFNEEEFYHETETSVDNIKEDYIITNNGSLEDLDCKVIDVMQDVIRARKAGNK